MSEYILILVWLGFMAIMANAGAGKRTELVCGEQVQRYSWLFAFVVFVPIIWMAGHRGYVGDTYAYEMMYKDVPDTFGELVNYLPQIKKDKGFTLLAGLIKIFFGGNTTIYFCIIAAIQGIALLYVYRKYSTDYLTAVFLFIASTDYLSWMFNGMRQFVAVTIIFAATPLMLKKKWVPLVIVILVASTIHGSALLMLPVVFIVQGKAWNKKTIFFTFACVAALFFADQFTGVLDTLLSDTQYVNVVSDWQSLNDDGTNIIRVLVYSIPAILSFIGRKWLNVENNECINLCTNMSIISAAIYMVSAGTSGVFLGRLPIFTSLYSYILLPYLIEQMFTKELVNLVKTVMIAFYLAFYYYQIHFTWGLI